MNPRVSYQLWALKKGEKNAMCLREFTVRDWQKALKIAYKIGKKQKYSQVRLIEWVPANVTEFSRSSDDSPGEQNQSQ